MAKLLITTDAHDFIVVNTTTKQIVHQQGPTEALDAKHLAGKNRPTFRPFGIDFDNEFIYVASNDQLGKFKKSTYEFDSLINIPLFINTHQIIKDKSTIYTCNTAIDCIGVYDLDDEYYAQFNVNFLNDFDVVNMPANADQLDSRHLNSLYDAGDKIYFCRHNKNLVPSDYGVLDKASMQGEIIASAGRSCHGIRIVNNHLYSLSTATGQILSINLDTKETNYHNLVDPKNIFLRGFDIYDDKLIIGASSNLKSESNKVHKAYLILIDYINNTSEQFELPGVKTIHDLKVMPD